MACNGSVVDMCAVLMLANPAVARSSKTDSKGRNEAIPAKRSQMSKWHTFADNSLSINPIHSLQPPGKLASFRKLRGEGNPPRWRRVVSTPEGRREGD